MPPHPARRQLPARRDACNGLRDGGDRGSRSSYDRPRRIRAAGDGDASVDEVTPAPGELHAVATEPPDQILLRTCVEPGQLDRSDEAEPSQSLDLAVPHGGEVFDAMACFDDVCSAHGRERI